MSPTSQFDRVTESYEQFAPAQRGAAEELLKMLPQTAERILEIGPGPGTLSQELVKKYPGASFSFVDKSAPMLDSLADRFGSEVKAQFICDDFAAADLEDGYDLIVSSSTLHWAQPLSGAIGQARRLLGEGGTFTASLMVAGTLDELFAAKAAIAPHKDLSAALPTIEAVQSELRAAGFRIANERVAEFKMPFPSGRHLFQHLRATGVNGGTILHNRLNRSELGALLRVLEPGITVTYRCYLFRT